MEPIAIIGIGCRFPGAQNPEAFWQILRNGVDTISEVPSERWDIDTFYHPEAATPGKMYTRSSGFLEQIDRFDPSFFRISPREAQQIDPQQRLLLEVTWEALENAGIAPASLAGSQTAVFIGISNIDYRGLVIKDLSAIEAYSSTGTNASIAANRLSYFLNLKGPSLAIDTACSSSLVALHYACQSLQSRESHLSLVGGVNLMLSPEPTISFSQARMLAADGRCKTFDASADGYARGEGCGVIVLKRLTDAISDGDHIQAVIKGSAVNQDGLTNGMTAPNGPSQQAVIRQALANAGVAPAQISYVEAHGTGTLLGDPIEVKSLKSVLMEDRAGDRLCWIGSVKTNIGHLEAAAGIAGLIKVVLSLQHQEIPPHLHLKQLNPYLKINNTPIQIPTELQPWQTGSEQRLAGVSSFGFGGTNAHVILEEAPIQTFNSKEFSNRPYHLLTLSAKCEQALQELVQRYEEFLVNNSTAAIADICFTANTGRSHFDHRLAMIASDKQELANKLAKISARAEPLDVFARQIPGNYKSPKIAFLFTGQGSQYVNMGCQLYETQPIFRQVIDECAQLMEPDLEQPLLSVLYPEDRDRHLIDRTIYAQPTLFALEYALYRLWQSWGVVPAAVLGHSVGEYVAAVVAGVMNLADGVRLVSARAKLMQSLPSTGEMIAVFTTPDEIQKVVTIDGQSLSFAAYNNPQNTVISGDSHAIAAACDALTTAGIGFKQLRTSHAFHSVLMEPILAQFRQVTAAISYHPPQIPLISNLTGRPVGESEIDAEYWCQHLRQTVKFADGLHTLDKLGIDIFLEIGPKPTLISIGQQCLTASNQMWLNSLRPNREDWMEMLNSLARLAVKGTEIDWAGFDRDYVRQRIPLPTYPFQRKSYWIDAPTETILLASMHSNENPTFSSQNLAPATVVDMTNQQRQRDILAQLHTSVAKLLKADSAEVDVNAPFLEMGADSLVLVEAIGYVERTFGIKIGIRQIFEELTTIALLAKYIHEQIPLEITSPEPVLATSTNGKSATNGNSSRYTESTKLSSTSDIIQSTGAVTMNSASGLERIMQQQLQVVSNTMSDIVAQQLSVLREQTGNFEPAPNATKGIDAKKYQPVVSTVNEHRKSPPLPPIADRSRLQSTLQLSPPIDLDRFINSYTQKTFGSKNATQISRDVLADSRASAGFRPSIKELVYPIIGDRAAGAYCWDIDGNKYIDITMGFGVLLFGHNPQFVKDAISTQLERGLQIGPQAPLAGEVARSIAELTGTERVAFCNSGTEAVMTAIRLARHTTGRHKIVIFTNSYHGHFDGILATASQGQSIPSTTGIAPLSVSDVFVLEYGEDSALEILRANATEIAAVIVEPVQSRNLSLQPREFLQQLRQATADSGIALVFDEVLLGFRIHQGGAQAWFDIKADLITYGKIIGGGLPIGVVAGRAEYLDGIDGGSWSYGNASYPSTEKTFFAGTFNKNHLGMAAAHAVLQHLKAVGPSLQTELNQRTLRLVSTLNDFFISEEVPIKVINFGSLFRFTFSGNLDQFFYHLIAQGIYIWEGRACFLSTAHTDEDVNQIVQAIEATVREMRNDGFWTRSSSGSATLPFSQQQATTVSSTATAKVEQADSSPSSKVWNRQKPLGSRVDRKPGGPTQVTNFSPANRNKKLDFSLYYFGEYQAQFSQGKYDLLFAGAKFADRHGFTAIWIPERHFHSFGGFSPNPSILGAGLARETDKIQIRAGSVVLPLHHPIRVAEEWSVVDNLSQGRVGIAFASGWHPNDFVFAPESYGNHRELMFQGIETVQKLWRGESIPMRGGAGNQIDVQTFPLPMQSQLPTWITVVNNPETYIKAGEIGAGVLTNLMNQTVEDLAENIAIYRESLFKNGYDQSSGQVTVLLHTLLGNNIDTVRQQARQPFCNYLRSSLGLFQNLVKSQGLQVDIDSLSEDDKNFILSAAFDRYVQNSALIGTPDSCTPIVNNLLAIGVDEIACFIDFGVDMDIALEGLPYINELKERYQNFAPDIGGKSLQTSDETVSIPLTKAQQQLWFLVQLGDNSSAAYNESVILQLRGELKLAAMQQALQTVVDRHEALRTRIDKTGEVQHIFPSVKIDVPVIDFSDVNGDEQESQLADWLQEDSQTPFDFTQSSLFRCRILKLEAQQHLLVVSAHHVITDGWSMGIIVQEIAAIYSAECQGTNLQFPPPLQFRTYAQWLEQQAETETMASHKSYWVDQLYAQIPVLELPTDRPRRVTKTFRANRQTIQLDTNLSNDLRKVSREQGCTLFMTMLSAYKTLLHRLTGQDDILIGIPTAGRSLTGSQELIGYCTHLLPIRSQFVDNLSFLEYLRTLRGILLNAYEHQDYPFANLLNHLSEQRKNNHSPLITATFNLERSLAQPEMCGLDTSLYSGSIGFADHDLSLNVTEVNTEIVLSCDYSTDLFDTETIGRMLGHFQTLLTEIVANPDRQISTLPILTNTERHQLLFNWNDTQTDYPQNKCIHQLFEEQVAKTPDAIAVVFEQEELTYQQLNKRANQLAHHLQTLGVKPEVLVGICVERSLEMVVGLLGILKAGGAYVPLDLSYPAERLSYLLSDAGIEVLLTQNNLLSTLPSHLAQVVCLDTDGGAIESHSQDNLVTGVSAENLAYVIYTSGSTGQPKGVTIAQRNLVQHGMTMAAEYRLTASDRVLQFAALSFDVALEEILPTWLSGATVVLRPQAMFTSMVEWVDFINTHNLTVLNLPAAFWQEWIVNLSTSPQNLPSCLRLVIVGSEQVQWSRVALWQKHVPSHIELYNAYGVTEATITATVYKSDLANQEERTGIVPIGKPIANTQVYILDSQLQPVPIGVAGELHIGGDGLARGYLNRPELTQAKFVANPFSLDRSARLYKTGDLARYLPDGNIEFLGRLDHQVKIRGFRIELGEVEVAISKHLQVYQVTVVDREDRPGSKQLVAYVVLLPVQQLTYLEMRTFLQEKLPDYMIPTALVCLATLPVTPNGKIDRCALPAPNVSETSAKDGFAPPRNHEEKILSEIWAEVLSREQVGIHDNFFELGGDSILSIQILSRANQSGLHFTPKQLFQNQTIAGLAAVASYASSIQAEQGLVTGNVALTPIQHWFFNENLAESHHYNQSVLLEVPLNLEPQLLEQAVQYLLFHHDALRLSYQQSISTVRQINTEPNETTPFTVVDLSELPSQKQPAAIESTASQMQASLNLSQGSIVQVVLFRLGGDQPSRLLFIVHHLAIDGISWRILLKDLFTAYQQLLQGKPIQLPQKTTSFQEWAALLNAYAESGALSQELDYWLKHAQREINSLPTDYLASKQVNTIATTKQLLVTLDEAKTQLLLQEVPAAYNTQINDVLLTALGQSFAEWTGSDCLLIDLEGHGREELFENVDLSRTIGWFTTVFPVLLSLTNTENLGELLKSIKEQIRSIPNHGIGYGILRYVSPDPHIISQLAALPQAEVSFNYLGQFDTVGLGYPNLALAKESSGKNESPLSSRSYLLEIDGFVADGKLQFIWKYSENIYCQSTVEYLAKMLIKKLELIVNHCLKPDAGGYTPSDFPDVNLNQQELDELIGDFSIMKDRY